MSIMQTRIGRTIPIRSLSFDSTAAYSRAKPRPKPLKPPRVRPNRAKLRPPSLENMRRAEPWLYVAVGAGVWFSDLGEALRTIRPTQMSVHSRPTLEWILSGPDDAVWIGELTFLVPHLPPQVWTIGCKRERAQDFQHELLT